MYDEILVAEKEKKINELLEKFNIMLRQLDLSGQFLFKINDLSSVLNTQQLLQTEEIVRDCFNDAVKDFKNDKSAKKQSERRKDFIFWANHWIDLLVDTLNGHQFKPMSIEDCHALP